MGAFVFTTLTAKPAATDSIAIYEAGTTNLVTGLVDLAGAGLANPFTPADAGGVDFWGFQAPDGISYDVYSVTAGAYLAKQQGEPTFSGTLAKYGEHIVGLTITAGAASIDHSAAANVYNVPLVQDTTIDVTNLVAGKPLTLAVSQTGGPWTLTLTYVAKTLAVTLNGSADQALETVEVWCDGNDLFVPDAGGVLWSPGV